MKISDKKQEKRHGEDTHSALGSVALHANPDGISDTTVETRDMRMRKPSGTINPISAQEYGIEEAIALVRTLPTEDIELVVRVVKQTLESNHIDIPKIITDASRKEDRISKTISALQLEIAHLEKEVTSRKLEVENLKTDRDETVLVKERLKFAAKSPRPELARI